MQLNSEVGEYELRRRHASARALWEQVPRDLYRRQASSKLDDACGNWAGGSLILLGSTGSGKTASMSRLARRLCGRAVKLGGKSADLVSSSVWLRADDLTGFGGQTDDEFARRMLFRAERCRLLFLDDLATGSKTLHRVLQKRYDRKLPTIVTSGALTTREFVERIGGQAPMRWLMEAGKQPGKVVTA